MVPCRARLALFPAFGFPMIGVLLLGSGGCGKPAAPVASKTAATPAPATRSVGKPVTEAESLALAEAIEQAVNSGDAAALDRLIDWDSINQRTTAGVDAPEAFRKGFIQGLDSTRFNGKGVAGGIIEAVKKGGSYTLLHAHTKDNRPWLLFRLLLPDAGVNYHDLQVARRPDGKVKAVDIHVFLSGELLSDTFRRGYVQIAAQNNAGLIDRLTGNDKKFVKSYIKLGEMSEAARAGQFRQALEIFKTFPPEIQAEKSVLLVRLQAAQNFGDNNEYSRAIEDFRKAHPDDPCVDILSIDYHILKKQFPEALGCIDRLDKAVEGDPYLQTLRAGVHMEQGDLAAARADIKKAMDAAPDLIDPYWSLVTVSLKDENFDETLKTLRQIREKFGMQIGDLKTVPLYKEFTKSPQYQEWLKESEPAAGKAEGKESADKPKE